MIHEVAKVEPKTYTPGGNHVCTCGAVLAPGGLIPHLQQRLNEVEEEAALLRRMADAQAKSRLSAGVITKEGRRLF